MVYVTSPRRPLPFKEMAYFAWIQWCERTSPVRWLYQQDRHGSFQIVIPVVTELDGVSDLNYFSSGPMPKRYKYIKKYDYALEYKPKEDAIQHWFAAYSESVNSKAAIAWIRIVKSPPSPSDFEVHIGFTTKKAFFHFCLLT